MLFSAVSTIHTHLSQTERQQGLARRAEWKWPANVKVVHEVWRASAPEIISTFECDSYEPLMSIQLAWSDFMQLSISPATTPEEGLKIGAKLLGGQK